MQGVQGGGGVMEDIRQGNREGDKGGLRVSRVKTLQTCGRIR